MHGGKQSTGTMRSALADFSEADREVILFVMQHDYGIRFDLPFTSSLKEIKRALKNILGDSADRVIARLSW